MNDPGASMDTLHCKVLTRLVALPGIYSVVEVGSYKGVSTKAIFDAARGFVVLYEIDPLPELLDLIDSYQGGVHLHTTPYWENPEHGDLVFIDGDHCEGALKDALTAVTSRAEIIVMHDSQLEEGWGSRAAVEILKKSSGWIWFEDCKVREGMNTGRGLFVAVRSESPEDSTCVVVKRIFEDLE